jgi:hypothetical protein
MYTLVSERPDMFRGDAEFETNFQFYVVCYAWYHQTLILQPITIEANFPYNLGICELFSMNIVKMLQFQSLRRNLIHIPQIFT